MCIRSHCRYEDAISSNRIRDCWDKEVACLTSWRRGLPSLTKAGCGLSTCAPPDRVPLVFPLARIGWRWLASSPAAILVFAVQPGAFGAPVAPPPVLGPPEASPLARP